MQKKTILGFLTLCLSFQALAQTDEREYKRDSAKSSLEVRSLDGNYSVAFSGYLQTNAMLSYSPDTSKTDLDLELNAARISVSGTAFNPRLTYFFQAALEREVTNNASLSPTGLPQAAAPNASSSYLRDYYVNIEAHKDAQVRVGKFGMPFSRQAMFLGTDTQFYTANIASSGILLNGNGKDVGVMVHNGRNSMIEYGAAVVSNGLVARLGYNHNNIDGYEPTDFHGGPLRFAVAVNGLAQMNYRSPALDDLRAGMDFILKTNHFSTNGAFYYKFLKQARNGQHNLGAGVDFGYLMADRYEPVLRYGWLNNGARNAHEILAGFNYYIYGQNLKLQTYGGLRLTESRVNNLLLGTQFQFAL